MEPLSTNKRVLAWLLVCPPQEPMTKTRKSISILLIITIVTTVIFIGIASWASFWKYVFINLEKSLYSLFPFECMLSTFYTIIVTYQKRAEISSIFELLSEIYSTNQQKDSFRYLMQASIKSEVMWMFFFKYAMVGIIFNTGSLCIISVIFCEFKYGYFDADHLYHPFEVLLPWNQKTGVGYFFEICLGLFWSEDYFLTNGSLLLLFISISIHHQAFYQMFKHSVQKANSCQCDQQKMGMYCDLICLHNSVKRWFIETSAVYSHYIAIQLVYSMFLLACAVFHLDLQIKHLDFTIAILLMAVFCGLGSLFSFCYYGKLSTNHFGKMADCLFYESNFIESPVKMQKYLILMIQNAQRPIYYHGFGMAILNLETFSKVLKTVFSYYWLLKAITTD